MGEDEIERLTEKYKKGKSNLNEEQFLIENAKDLEPSLKTWFTFVKKNKIEPPKNFNEKLWESFQNKRTRTHKMIVGIISAAASVVLLISFFVFNPTQKEQDYLQKEAILNEALDMVRSSELVEMKQNIIYENEIIIIYSTTE